MQTKQDDVFLGGGVTFTGGEATLQHKELLEILKLLKDEGIHTCIETNGTSPKLEELLPFIDYLTEPQLRKIMKKSLPMLRVRIFCFPQLSLIASGIKNLEQ